MSELCLGQFVKMYEPAKHLNKFSKEEDSEEELLDENLDKIDNL